MSLFYYCNPRKILINFIAKYTCEGNCAPFQDPEVNQSETDALLKDLKERLATEKDFIDLNLTEYELNERNLRR